MFKVHRVGIVVAVLSFGGLCLLGQGTYIHVKALLAQVLLESAWANTLTGETGRKPWPWADTWPVGRLSISRLGVDRIVLAGVSGEALAFGPGHLSASAYPGEPGNIVIAGHRDTHFRFLDELLIGDRIDLENPRGGVQRYAVSDRFIVYENDTLPMEYEGKPQLTLVTCYPFDAIRPGGPLRYVVRAGLIGKS